MFKWILPLILLLSFSLRLHNLDGESLWYDELVSVDSITHNSFLQLPRYILIREGAPPLYFLLLKLWSFFNLSTFSLRLFSVLTGVLGVWGIYLLGKEWKGERVGWLASFLTAISPYHIWYSQEMRMYSLLFLLVVFSSYFFLRYLHQPSSKNLSLYLLTSILALLTHPHAIFILLTHTLYAFLVRSPIFRWSLIPIILFIPYIFVLLNLLKTPKANWLPHLTPLTFYSIFRHFTLGLYPGVPVWIEILVVWGILVPFSLSVYRLYKENKKEIVLLTFFFPFFLLISISLFKPVIFEGRRYMIILLPFFYLLLSYTLQKIKGWSLLVILPFIFPAKEIYLKTQKRPWREVAKIIKEEGETGDAYLILGMSGRLLKFYSLNLPYINLPSRVTSEMVRERMGRFSRVWIITISPRLTPLELFLTHEGNYRVKRVFQTDTGQGIRLGIYSRERKSMTSSSSVVILEDGKFLRKNRP